MNDIPQTEEGFVKYMVRIKNSPTIRTPFLVDIPCLSVEINFDVFLRVSTSILKRMAD
jgi:hypothetical protein